MKILLRGFPLTAERPTCSKRKQQQTLSNPSHHNLERYSVHLLQFQLSSSISAMGRTFFEHMGGAKVISCNSCGTPLTNKENIESGNYQGSSGKAFLFSKATNLRYSEVMQRNMITGMHYVRDVYCKGCSEKIGWMYEFAVPDEQRHKEGKVILEKAFICDSR